MCSGARRRTAYWLRRPLTLTDYGTHRGTLSARIILACMRPLSAHCWPLTLLSQKYAIDHSIDKLSTSLRIAEGRLQPTYDFARTRVRHLTALLLQPRCKSCTFVSGSRPLALASDFATDFTRWFGPRCPSRLPWYNIPHTCLLCTT